MSVAGFQRRRARTAPDRPQAQPRRIQCSCAPETRSASRGRHTRKAHPPTPMETVAHAHTVLVQWWSGLEKPSARETHLEFSRFGDRNGACTAAEGHRNDRYTTVTLPSACRRHLRQNQLCLPGHSGFGCQVQGLTLRLLDRTPPCWLGPQISVTFRLRFGYIW